jgi:hypothetical protein
MSIGVAMIIWLVAPILVGVFAQKVRGRTGIVWFLVAGALEAAAIAILDAATTSGPKYAFDPSYRQMIDGPGGMAALTIMAVGFCVVATGTILMTLPTPISKSPPSDTVQTASSEATKSCPRCAETVKAAAKVCRFCQHEFEGAG